MKPKIVHAKNYEVMCELADLFIESKFKIKSRGDNYILLRKLNYGNYFLHALFIIIALFIDNRAILVNVFIFGYSLFQKSNNILITTEKIDDKGNPLEFDDVGSIEVFYDEETWDKAIELSRLD